jgi:hypothetical protein
MGVRWAGEFEEDMPAAKLKDVPTQLSLSPGLTGIARAGWRTVQGKYGVNDGESLFVVQQE